MGLVTNQDLLPPSRSDQLAKMHEGSAPLQSLEASVLRTLAYGDVFDYPMTAAEIHRYLIGLQVSFAEVESFMRNGVLRPGLIQSAQGYYSLVGGESKIKQRLARAQTSADLWTKARAYGRLIGRLPYVRMVAVTGALAVNNSERDDDIDFLVVTLPGRLWTCRAMVVALVRWASLRGVSLCPNYFVSTQALEFRHRSLYTAHELVQMVPLSGMRFYSEMRRRNAWTADYLPNATGPPPGTQNAPAGQRKFAASHLAERIFQTRIGASLERWEMERKIDKLTGQARINSEVAFCADWCKGHFDSHGGRTMRAYKNRLRELSHSISYPIQE